jgi:urease accessory protein
MIRSFEIRPAGTWSGPPADRVALTYDDRHRRRMAMDAEGGLSFLLDLAEARVLRDGDGVLLEDGRIVAIQAKPEPLLEVRGFDGHHLIRLAWHLGNRHLPAAIEPDRILIRPDHVIAAMLSGLGARITAVEAPFDPEGGAYGHASGQNAGAAHDHGHGTSHIHSHPHG